MVNHISVKNKIIVFKNISAYRVFDQQSFDIVVTTILELLECL